MDVVSRLYTSRIFWRCDDTRLSTSNTASVGVRMPTLEHNPHARPLGLSKTVGTHYRSLNSWGLTAAPHYLEVSRDSSLVALLRGRLLRAADSWVSYCQGLNEKALYSEAGSTVSEAK